MTTDELASLTLDRITQEITQRERDRILALIEAEIKDWYSQPNISGKLISYQYGAIEGLKVLRELIVKG